MPQAWRTLGRVGRACVCQPLVQAWVQSCRRSGENGLGVDASAPRREPLDSALRDLPGAQEGPILYLVVFLYPR